MTLPNKADLSTYGGALNDYAPVEDPTTDRPASAVNSGYADLAGCTRMVPRAWVTFTGHGTTPALVAHDAVWGNSGGVQPVIARTGTGVFTVTWPTSITDALGVSISVNLQLALAEAEGLTYKALASRTAANVVTVTCGSLGAAPPTANDLVGVVIKVWAW